MGTIKPILFYIALIISIAPLPAQNDIIKDTILAGDLFKKALDYDAVLKYDSAQVFYQKSCDLYLKLTKNTSLPGEWASEKYLTSLYRLSRAHLNEGEKDQALTISDRIISYSQGIFGENQINVANAYNIKGVVQHSYGNYNLALNNFLKALQSIKGIEGKDDLMEANIHNNIGLVYFDLKNYDQAIEQHQKAILIRTDQVGNINPEIAKAYNYLGINYQYKGNFNLANDYFSKAASIKSVPGGNSDPAIAWSYRYKGSDHFKLKEYDLALDCLNKALKIYIGLYGNLHDDVASTYRSIAVIYNVQRNYETALKFYGEVYNIKKSLYGENHAELASSCNEMGLCYFNSGKYLPALEYFQKALIINEKVKGGKSGEVADSYTAIGECYKEIGKYDLAKEYYEKSLNIQKELYGESNLKLIAPYTSLGYIYLTKAEPDPALEIFQKCMKIITEYPGEKDSYLANLLNNIGAVYMAREEFDLAIQFTQKSIDVAGRIDKENHPAIASSYNNLWLINMSRGEYNSALQYFFKALSIQKNIYGDNHPELIKTYNNIGDCYRNKKENNLAIEYLTRAATMGEELLGENHPFLASIYTNIASCYFGSSEFDLALPYYQKAIVIMKANYGEKHPELAMLNNNVAMVYLNTGDYDPALQHELSALAFYEEHPDDYRTDIAMVYSNIGLIFYLQNEFDDALKHLLKAVALQKEVFGLKHPSIAKYYRYLAHMYANQGGMELSLKYYQRALTSNLRDYNDSLNYHSYPTIKNFFDPLVLLESFYGKANVFFIQQNLKESFTNIQLCDSLIGIMRKSFTSQPDKLALGNPVHDVCNGAIQLCFRLALNPPPYLSREDLFEQGFYFSDKSKSSVLIEALAGQESLKYAGIPDNLLQMEHTLKTGISYYERKLVEAPDSTNETKYLNQLFKINRQYDSLISRFERDFPGYYDLKFGLKNFSLKDLQSILDDKTAIRSYFTGDSSIYIFTLTKEKLDLQQVKKITNLNDSIEWFRFGLTKLSSRMQNTYARIGYKLYQQLFPKSTLDDEGITDLIIIPDDYLCTIPFETLLTSNYIGDVSGYRDYPFLLRKYNISYSYSAKLFYKTYSNTTASITSEIAKSDNWIGIAPVFDNKIQGTLMTSTNELKRQLAWLKTDSLLLNRDIFNRGYISPLPATEIEIQSIFKLYHDYGLKGKVLKNNDANEQFIKSEGLKGYKTLHFATHGLVNSERPDLSGLLLAQDSTTGEDGVLYSGEIYNLNLNSDLVVLSACETGLGKVQRGEGVIGLTRAWLYAGAKNIIVSLWQVADQSTSNLMVDFYKNMLERKAKLPYAEALRNAKLKMIEEGEFAHPLYWSPFILIGK